MIGLAAASEMLILVASFLLSPLSEILRSPPGPGVQQPSRLPLEVSQTCANTYISTCLQNYVM